MSTESHDTGQEPRHTDVSFEERDVQTGTIYGYLLALGLAVVASALICVYILRFTLNYAASTDTPPPPSREALGKDYRMMPPEPRLQGVPGHQTDPQADLRKKIQEDSEANEKLEWIDRSSGIAQIPVKDAMKIIAEKGLPAGPAPVMEKKK
jgi:7-keto-8-aminopelargonate synthetase-like enzyme